MEKRGGGGEGIGYLRNRQPNYYGEDIHVRERRGRERWVVFYDIGYFWDRLGSVWRYTEGCAKLIISFLICMQCTSVLLCIAI